MLKDDAYLLEIVQACEKALKYVEAIDQVRFFSNEMLHDAVMLQLIVIGEAAKNLSDQFREAHSEIPWSKIRATRNVVAHAYHIVDLERIWIAVTDGLPLILNSLKPLVPSENFSEEELPPTPDSV